MRTRPFTVPALLLAAGLLTACTAPDGGGPEPTPSAAPFSASDFSAEASVAWSTPLGPAGEPALIGDSVLAYDGSDGLRLTSLDAATGAVRWSADASTGDVPPSAEFVPAVTTTDTGRAVVAYLAPPVLNVDIDYHEHTLALADAATGEVLFSTVGWMSGVETCAFSNDICFAVWDLPSQSWKVQHLDVDSGAITALVQPVGDGRDFDDLGHGVYSYARADGTPVMGRFADGASVWEKPSAEVLGEAITTVERARVVVVDDETSTMVVSVSRPTVGAEPVSLTPGDFATAAFDLTTGEHRWTSEAGILGCAAGPALLCQGAIVYERDSATSVFELKAEDVTITRPDLATGAALWTVEVRGAKTLANGRSHEGVGSVDAGFVFGTADGYRILLHETGEIVDLEPGAEVACTTPTLLDGTVSSNPLLESQTFTGGKRWQACSGADRPAKDPAGFSRGAVEGAANDDLVASSGLRIVQTFDAVTAFSPAD